MIPIIFRSTLRGIWGFMTFKCLFLACLSLWAVVVQMQYRIPSQFLFLVLPWIGVVLTFLSFIFLLDHLLRWISIDHSFQQYLRRIELGISLLIWIFVCYSMFVYANGRLDRFPVLEKSSEVLEISGGELDLGWMLPYAWVDLKSWKKPSQTERLFLYGWEQRKLWVGEAVTIRLHEGFFGIPWISRIDQDEEKHALEVLKLTPTAASAWKKLITFYLDHQRWKEAATSGQSYLKYYPNAYDFIFYIGSTLSFSGHYTEGVPFLEHVVTRRPTYEAYQSLGWSLDKQRKMAQAVEVLEASIPLRPDDYEAYYHLGYVYKHMEKFQEAIAMFEKVLERRPHFPEVEEQIANLRQQIAFQRPKITAQVNRK